MKAYNIVMADVAMWDYPNFSDAYIDSAEHEDGTEFTEQELELLNENSELVHQKAHESIQ